MQVLFGDSVESAIPDVIPLISSAAERTDTGSAGSQLIGTSTKNNWQWRVIIVLVSLKPPIAAGTSKSMGNFKVPLPTYALTFDYCFSFSSTLHLKELLRNPDAGL